MDTLDNQEILSPVERHIVVQKTIKIPQGVIEDFKKLKGKYIKASMSYSLTCILQAVMPRILEKVETERLISLDGIVVRL